MNSGSYALASPALAPAGTTACASPESLRGGPPPWGTGGVQPALRLMSRLIKLTVLSNWGRKITGKRYWVIDDALSGFRSLVSANSKKMYCLRIRSGCPEHRNDNFFKIGDACVLTPQETRDEAQTLLARRPFLLLTGCREQEVLQRRWGKIDRMRSLVILP